VVFAASEDARADRQPVRRANEKRPRGDAAPHGLLLAGVAGRDQLPTSPDWVVNFIVSESLESVYQVLSNAIRREQFTGLRLLHQIR
jgi:hypothetical protein